LITRASSGGVEVKHLGVQFRSLEVEVFGEVRVVIPSNRMRYPVMPERALDGPLKLVDIPVAELRGEMLNSPFLAPSKRRSPERARLAAPEILYLAKSQLESWLLVLS
jgi:hypothetical protein